MGRAPKCVERGSIPWARGSFFHRNRCLIMPRPAFTRGGPRAFTAKQIAHALGLCHRSNTALTGPTYSAGALSQKMRGSKVSKHRHDKGRGVVRSRHSKVGWRRSHGRLLSPHRTSQTGNTSHGRRPGRFYHASQRSVYRQPQTIEDTATKET